MSNLKSITIEISETIRVAPYEVIKPGITGTFEIPPGVDVDEFYQECYRELKRLWNKQLINMLHNSDKRMETEDVKSFALDLLHGKEKFLNLNQKPKDQKNG